MLSILFALPISIADLAERKIPNIYLYFYLYICFFLVSFNGFANLAVTFSVSAIVISLGAFGMGMGDIKLIFLISLILKIHSIYLVAYLLTLIFLFSGIHIMVSWSICKVFPASIAMAPSIFIGTSLYLATSGA